MNTVVVARFRHSVVFPTVHSEMGTGLETCFREMVVAT